MTATARVNRRQPLSALLNIMCGAAEKVGRKLVRDFGEIEHLQVSRKGPADFVSAADRRAEEMLRAELAKARPKYGFLLEESGQICGEDTCNTWIVDPLDGTTNFLHGIPHFAISIGLERDGEVVAGVIYSPVQDELFWAEKGSGAFMNGRRLRVAARTDLSECVFATGIPFKGTRDHKLFLRQLEGVMAVSAGVRRFGSAALDMAYVAAGRFDGYWETDIRPWDMAAGIVIARESGCLVTDLAGGQKMMETGSVLCAGSRLHGPLGELLAKAAPGPAD
ncbi:MAG: inositol monophosphatase [Magnetospirillum sp. WYHS-4]